MNKKNIQKADILNYLLSRFNDFDVPIQMSPKEIRELLLEFFKELED